MNANNAWKAGSAPIAVVMISLNEAHNLKLALDSLVGWAQDVFLVDSCSSDETVSIALEYGVTVIQRKFRGFGDQWNFALAELPIRSPWTMKLDPDERLTDELKDSLIEITNNPKENSIFVNRKLWFMGVEIPVEQSILRVWRTGTCKFTDVTVNEYPVVAGLSAKSRGHLEHRDSPDLEHWLNKQNKYTTAEAVSQFYGAKVALPPKLFGNATERRMWLKRNFWRIPGRYLFLFVYHYLFLGTWRSGRVGWIWSHLRVEVYRLWEFKRIEMEWRGYVLDTVPYQVGNPDLRVRFYE